MERPTRIVPLTSNQHYVFYQYSKANRNKSPARSIHGCFFESGEELSAAFDRFVQFLGDLKKHRQAAARARAASSIWSPRKSIVCLYVAAVCRLRWGFFRERESIAQNAVGQLFESLGEAHHQGIGVTCETSCHQYSDSRIPPAANVLRAGCWCSRATRPSSPPKRSISTQRK